MFLPILQPVLLVLPHWYDVFQHRRSQTGYQDHYHSQASNVVCQAFSWQVVDHLPSNFSLSPPIFLSLSLSLPPNQPPQDSLPPSAHPPTNVLHNTHSPLPPSPKSKTRTLSPLPKHTADRTRHTTKTGDHKDFVSYVTISFSPLSNIKEKYTELTPSRLYSTTNEPYDTTKIPDFSHYKKSDPANAETQDESSRAFTYMMVGATGVLGAIAAKATVIDLLASMSASADVLALAKVEVSLGNIPEGKNVVLKWRGKPIFIRHRTAEEIQEAQQLSVAELRDPETDEARTKKPEWLVMIGVCTHLGCVPVGEAGEFGGWFCPCHGSHYDISGRIRKGPAPLNLEIPPYEFLTDDQLLIG